MVELGNLENEEEDNICAVECFICQFYVPGTVISSVKEVQWFLLRKCEYTNEKIPLKKPLFCAKY